MDLLSTLEGWQRILALPIIAGLLEILRRMHPLRLLQRVLSFGIGVKEREMLLAQIEAERAICAAEKASGLRWMALWQTCQADLKVADAENAHLRTFHARNRASADGGT